MGETNYEPQLVSRIFSINSSIQQMIDLDFQGYVNNFGKVSEFRTFENKTESFISLYKDLIPIKHTGGRRWAIEMEWHIKPLKKMAEYKY